MMARRPLPPRKARAKFEYEELLADGTPVLADFLRDPSLLPKKPPCRLETKS